MGMLTQWWKSFQNMYVHQIITLHISNILKFDFCQLDLNNTERKG